MEPRLRYCQVAPAGVKPKMVWAPTLENSESSVALEGCVPIKKAGLKLQG